MNIGIDRTERAKRGSPGPSPARLRAPRSPGCAAVASVSISMPSVRYDRSMLPQLVAQLRRSVAGLERDLARA